MEAYGGEDVLLHILDLCARQTERNGHTPTALPIGKKPFGPNEQKAQRAPALALMLWRRETSPDPIFLSRPAHSLGITPAGYSVKNDLLVLWWGYPDYRV
jgi:hypothetical protein